MTQAHRHMASDPFNRPDSRIELDCYKRQDRVYVNTNVNQWSHDGVTGGIGSEYICTPNITMDVDT